MLHNFFSTHTDTHTPCLIHLKHVFIYLILILQFENVAIFHTHALSFSITKQVFFFQCVFVWRVNEKQFHFFRSHSTNFHFHFQNQIYRMEFRGGSFIKSGLFWNVFHNFPQLLRFLWLLLLKFVVFLFLPLTYIDTCPSFSEHLVNFLRFLLIFTKKNFAGSVKQIRNRRMTNEF